MRVCLSSIMSVARHLALTALIAMSCTLPLAAQETKPQSLPILFDARERLPKPDLSSLVRLRFLTSIDFPPFNFLDQNGKLTGFHVELARKICDELAIADKCQIQALPFGELQGALAASQGDAVIAGVAVTPELRKTFAFSRPFLMLPARFVRNLKASIGGTTAASLSGHPVGVVKGTVHEAMLTAFFPAIKPMPFDDKDGLLAAVKDGKIDAAFADGLQLSFWVSSPAAENAVPFRRSLPVAAISRRRHDHHAAPAGCRSDGRDQPRACHPFARWQAAGNLSALFPLRALLISAISEKASRPCDSGRLRCVRWPHRSACRGRDGREAG